MQDSMEGAGQGGPTRIRVSEEPVEPGLLSGLVADPGGGALCLFLGTVRDHSPGREGVWRLEYEAYPGVVEARIAEIVDETRERWPVLRVAVDHRLGPLGVGEISLGIAVSSAHRAEAFAAARYLIEEIRARAPIWKKERWEGGAEWVGGEVPG